MKLLRFIFIGFFIVEGTPLDAPTTWSDGGCGSGRGHWRSTVQICVADRPIYVVARRDRDGQVSSIDRDWRRKLSERVFDVQDKSRPEHVVRA